MATDDDIITISNSGEESKAPKLGIDARISMPDAGTGYKLSKLAQKVLVAGTNELIPPDRSDRQLKSLVGPRTILGQDDRIRVKATKGHPWRMICQVTTTWKNGSKSFGTGWLAGPLTVVTAGHCVFDIKLGWAKSVFVIPGCDEKKVPFGGMESKRFGSTSPWITSQAIDFDIASIHLPKAFGSSLGHFAFAALSDQVLEDHLVNITGYPGDKGNDQLWHDRNKVVKLDERRVWYQADTERGQSGSPVYAFFEGIDKPPVVVGVHSLGASELEEKNSATRLTPALAGAVRQWTVQSLSLSGKEEAAATASKASGKTATTAKNKEESLPKPRIIYMPGAATLPNAELKQSWDEALFGHSLGDNSHLFYYSDDLPELNVPVRPHEPTMDSVGKKLEEEVGKGAAKLAMAMSDAVIYTGENQLLYGLEHSIRWVTLVTRYFKGKREKDKSPYRDLVRDQFLKYVLADDELSEVLIVAHGFGAVVAYDLLTNLKFRKQLPRRFNPTTLVTLGSPLGYKPIKNHFRPFRYPRETEKSKTASGIKTWFDVAIREDPVASDEELFPDEKTYELFTPDDMVARAGLDEFFAEMYLTLPRAKSFIKSRLPPGFAAPVKKFVIARNVADKLSDTAKRMDVLIELNSRVGKPTQAIEPGEAIAPESEPEDVREAAKEGKSVLQLRSQSVVDTIRKVISKGATLDDLEIDLMHRYVGARLLPGELRRFVLEMEKQSENKGKEELVVHHVWGNAEMRCLIHRSARVIQVGAARSAYSAYGAGIHWAVLDSGIDAEHKHFDLHENIVEALDFTTHNFRASSKKKYKCLDAGLGRAKEDLYGHGTHVAGIIGGQERQIPAPDTGELVPSNEDRHTAVAPCTKLHCYKVIGDEGSGRESSVIRALEHIYAVNANSHELVIHGVNLSIGCNFDPSVYACGHSPVCKEIRRLWEQGVIVCVAAGNAGLVDFDPDGGGHLTLNLALSIGDPANVEDAIAVGSVHAMKPHSYGISYFSSRGPTADGRIKPDCVAPGERISSAAAGKDGYRDDSGTSMASPHVSGLIAAFLSVRKEFIGRPDEVKKILLDNCTDIGRDNYHQGAGLPNLMKMLSNT